MKTQRSADIAVGCIVALLVKTEFMGPEEPLALVKKKMVEYEVIMKELGRIKKQR